MNFIWASSRQLDAYHGHGTMQFAIDDHAIMITAKHNHRKTWTKSRIAEISHLLQFTICRRTLSFAHWLKDSLMTTDHRNRQFFAIHDQNAICRDCRLQIAEINSILGKFYTFSKNFNLQLHKQCFTHNFNATSETIAMQSCRKIPWCSGKLNCSRKIAQIIRLLNLSAIFRNI